MPVMTPPLCECMMNSSLMSLMYRQARVGHEQAQVHRKTATWPTYLA